MKTGGRRDAKRPPEDLSRAGLERPIEELLRELAFEIDEATDEREGAAPRPMPRDRFVVRTTRHGKDH